jgi:hypothetical protein
MEQVLIKAGLPTNVVKYCIAPMLMINKAEVQYNKMVLMKELKQIVNYAYWLSPMNNTPESFVRVFFLNLCSTCRKWDDGYTIKSFNSFLCEGCYKEATKHVLSNYYSAADFYLNKGIQK